MPNYATLEETKDYLQVQNPVGSSHDVVLQTLINSASQKIDEFVGYTFEVEYGSDETLYNVRNLDTIVLRKYPIVGISNIESGVDFQRVDDIGKIVLDELFTGDFALSVSFGQNPPEIVKVTCMELVNLFWSRKQMTGLKSMSMGDFSFTTGGTLTNEITDTLNILNEYRDMPLSRTTTQSFNQMR